MTSSVSTINPQGKTTERPVSEEMTDVTTLMRCIGSPLLNNGAPFELQESEALLDLAFRNNVEMLYMSQLKAGGRLDRLAPAFEEFEDRRVRTAGCIVRIVSALDRSGIPYAVTKSLRPYPAIPNDTDVLYLGPPSDYEDAVAKIEQAGFRPEGGGKMQAQFFDPHEGAVFNRDKRGGRFYIDFYRHLAADHVPYMNSAVLRNHVITRQVGDVNVKVFEPVAEMTILYLHSVIMHRTFPLEVFASTAYWLSEMQPSALDRFAAFLEKNHATLVGATAFSLMAQLYAQAFGIVPEPILEMQKRLARHLLGRWRREQLYGQMPYICELSTFVLAVLEKIGEPNSFSGFCKQAVYMLNPVFFAEVMNHMMSRKRIRANSRHV